MTNVFVIQYQYYHRAMSSGKFIGNSRSFADILSNLPIGIRIGLLVMVALLTVAITTGLFLLADRRMDEASSELSSYGDLVVLAASAERRAADLLILARDFITDRNAGAAVTFATRTSEVESLLDRIANHPGATKAGGQVDGLRASVRAAAARFAEVRETGLGQFHRQPAVMMI
jgi:methyl-accepting chemotaxis protein